MPLQLQPRVQASLTEACLRKLLRCRTPGLEHARLPGCVCSTCTLYALRTASEVQRPGIIPRPPITHLRPRPRTGGFPRYHTTSGLRPSGPEVRRGVSSVKRGCVRRRRVAQRAGEGWEVESNEPVRVLAADQCSTFPARGHVEKLMGPRTHGHVAFQRDLDAYRTAPCTEQTSSSHMNGHFYCVDDYRTLLIRHSSTAQYVGIVLHGWCE